MAAPGRAVAILSGPFGDTEDGSKMTLAMRTLMATAALVASLASADAAAARYEFGTVIDNLDRRKVTKLHAQDYCRQAKGAEVSWSGKVYDVKGGRRSAKVYLANTTRPIYRGYNIVAVTTDLDAAARVRKGEQVRVTGSVDRCILKDNGAIIELDNVTVH
jgi:hypothetical protein